MILPYGSYHAIFHLIKIIFAQIWWYILKTEVGHIYVHGIDKEYFYKKKEKEKENVENALSWDDAFGKK